MKSIQHSYSTIAILTTLFFALTLAAAFTAQAATAVSETPPTPGALSPLQPPILPPAPAKLPDDIDRLCPIYPGAVLLQVEQGEAQSRAMFKSAAPPNEIADYYKKELTNRGWTVFKEMGDENSPRLILNKGNQQVGFSAMKQPSKVVTYFISLRNI